MRPSSQLRRPGVTIALAGVLAAWASASCEAPRPRPQGTLAPTASSSAAPSSAALGPSASVAAPGPSGAPAPAAAAPAAPLPPVENLAPLRVFDDPPQTPASYLRADGARFLGFAYTEVVLYDPRQSAPVTRYPVLSAGLSYPNVLEYTTRSLDGSWMKMVEADLLRIDTATGALLWRSELVPGVPVDPRSPDRVHVADVARDGAVALVRIDVWVAGKPPMELLGLDWATGRVLWRMPLAREEGGWGLSAGGGRSCLLLDSGVLRCVASDTGQVLWERRHAPIDDGALRALIPASRALAVASPRGVEVVDPATGALQRTIPTPGQAGAILDAFTPPIADGDLLYAMVLHPGPSPDVKARRLTAFDLAAGRVVWEASPVLVPVNRQGRAETHDLLAVDADSVYTCLHDGSLHAHDRATGAERFHLGLGYCRLVYLERDASGARPIVVTRFDGRTVLLTRGTRPMPSEQVHVAGRVLEPGGSPWAGRPVLVDGTAAWTDEKGRFEATVTGREVVSVSVPARLVSGGARVIPDGRAGPYTVEIRMAGPHPVD